MPVPDGRRQQVDQLRAQLQSWDQQRRHRARQAPVAGPPPTARAPDAAAAPPSPLPLLELHAASASAAVAMEPSGGPLCEVAAARGTSSSSGCAALDRLLPQAGFGRGTLVEFVGAVGSGAGTLAWLAAREAGRNGGAIVVVDRQKVFYPPAAQRWGVDLRQTLIVQPADRREELWALDQILRCAAVAAVWATLERLDGRWFRRLQLAAEAGGTLGLLLRARDPRRPAADPFFPSWADVQLHVSPVACSLPAPPPPSSSAPPTPAWCLEVHLLRCRHGRAGRKVMLALDELTGNVRETNGHETHTVPLVSPVAYPASASSSAPSANAPAGALRHG